MSCPVVVGYILTMSKNTSVVSNSKASVTPHTRTTNCAVSVTSLLDGAVQEHNVKTTNLDFCYFHIEILYVDIYKGVTCSMNIL